MDENNKELALDVKSTLSLSEAAEILGFKSFRQVNSLIKKGFLSSFKTKWSNNKRVSKIEVENLAKVDKI
jgi:hypothetical protein